MHDVIVIGGGPAGLQAALTLGRVHRTVRLIDSGSYRNDPADHMHNLIGHDGTPPAELRAAGLRDLAAYETVEVVSGTVESVTGKAGDFTVTLDDGSRHESRAVIVATGVRDELPDVEGLADAWGGAVAHCPFCHGHELSGGTIAVLGSTAAHLVHLSGFLRRLAERSIMLTGRVDDLDDECRATLEAVGAEIIGEKVERVEPRGDGLTLVMSDGELLEVDGLFVAPTVTQAASFVADLDLEIMPSGGIAIDTMGRTSVPGIYAAGDVAHHRELPMAMSAVGAALAAGLVAGGGAVADLMTAEREALVAD